MESTDSGRHTQQQNARSRCWRERGQVRTKSSSRTSEPYVAAGEQSSVRPKEPRYAAPIMLAVEAETILGGGRETVAVRRTEHSQS